MKALQDGIPKTKNKQIRDIFLKASTIAEDIISGKTPNAEEGPFGESLDLLSYELAKKSDANLTSFSNAKKIDDRLLDVYRDIIEGPPYHNIEECLILGLYGYTIGNYTDEDFRYLYRFTLKDTKNSVRYFKWLLKALAFIACIESDSPDEIVHSIREWIRFLGAPLPQPSELEEPLSQYGIDISEVLNSDGIKLLASIRTHPEYIEEAILGKTFEEVYSGINEWGPDGLQSMIFKKYKKKAYRGAQDKIKPDMGVQKATKAVSQHFQKSGFRISKEIQIPVKLQELPSPPPPEAINPIVFEMIPQKLRMQLMTSVAYASTATKIEVVFLGGPRIGRSGILIKTNNGGVLLDYGLSVANQTIPEWIPELETIDTVLVSHSHLDHIGGLPILYENYSGKWCSTNICGGITMVLLEDALKVGTPMPPRKHHKWDRVSSFNQSNIQKVSKNHVSLEIGKTNEVAPGVLVTPIDACHIPGSVSYLIDIEGFKILYTGDFNIDQSVLFPGADLPTDPNVVIFDGTYWGREDFNRAHVSRQLSNIIQEKGPVIIPSFAVGRSQEILKILDTIGITQHRNVIVAGMAEKVTKIVGVTGGWQGLKKNKTELDKDDVLVAGGGMMGGGLARYHFERHRDNPDAAVIPCGYLAPRTTGWNLMNGYEPHKCHVELARLSAHSSASNLQNYIKSCKGMKVMVHTPVEKTPKDLIIPELSQRMTFSV